MGTITATLASVIPIILLIALGIVLRRARVLDDAVVEGLKRLTVSVVLPAVLFTAFLSVEFRVEYLALVVIVPAACLVLPAPGHGVRRAPGPPPPARALFPRFRVWAGGRAPFGPAVGLPPQPPHPGAGVGGLGLP